MKRMQRVLRRLGHIDSENVVQLKGRAAAEARLSSTTLLTSYQTWGSC